MIEEKKETTENKKEAASPKKELENINIICSKHGLINNGALYLRYSTIQKDESNKTAIDNNNIFCIACLNDMYMKFQKSGEIGNISVNVKYKDGTESEEVPVEQADIKPAENKAE